MLFWFDDGPGTRKASTTLRSATTILPMFFASTLFVLVMLGQVNCEYNGPIGFYDHTLKDGQVTLAAGSVTVDKGNIKKYLERDGSCEARINDAGNIVVYYQGNDAGKNENTKKNGCAVDLLTTHMNMIKFKAVVKDKGPIVKCVTNCGPNRFEADGIENNLIPFVYSYSTTKENIAKFKGGQELEDKAEICRNPEKCKRGDTYVCQKWTLLMVGWNNMGTDCRVEKSGVFGHAALLGADSEKMIQDGDDSMGFELAITEKGGLNVTVDGKKIKGDGPPGPMFPGPPRSTNLTESRPCLAEGEDVAEPLTWKITGKTPAFDPGYSRLLVFYLLPQVSARVGKVFVPKGPMCEELYIEFDKKDYMLLVADAPTIAKPDTPTPPPVSVPGTKPTQKPTTTEPSSNAMVFVIGGVIFVVALIVAAGIFFFVVKKKKADPPKSGKGGDSTAANSKVDEKAKTKEKEKGATAANSKVDEKAKEKPNASQSK